MSEENIRQIEDFKSDLVKKIMAKIVGVLILFAISVAGTSVGFYYNTKNNIQNIQNDQAHMRIRQDQTDRALLLKVDKTDYVRELDEVKTILREIDRKIDRINR